MQTKLQSAIESVSNVVVGFGVAILSQILAFPMFDIHVPLSSN